MIIPESERSKEPLVGERVITHPDIVRANEWILTEYKPLKRELCIFVPCAKVKPYHISPSHRTYDGVIFSLLPEEKVHIVAFGTCGVTPRELDTEYPFMHYSFMLGKCNVAEVKKQFIEIESQRLKRYLEKTRENYKYRIAYCTGDFRKAMLKAIELSKVDVVVVPKEETLERNKLLNKSFAYGSLSRREYLQDLADAITQLYGMERRLVGITATSRDNYDWYLL
jgi:predicted RNA-binding protein